MGLSPLVRGNLLPGRHDRGARGPIPARAGKPVAWCARTRAITAYPRSCGETRKRTLMAVPFWGLSPLVRGNPAKNNARVGVPGPIPARAGKPVVGIGTLTLDAAYPRSCGETDSKLPDGQRIMGLSPLVRGKPPPAGCTRSTAKAYPRSCGETHCHGGCSREESGLSPLVRGNRLQTPGRPENNGPIPARAGKPGPVITHIPKQRAYPRSCGETSRDVRVRTLEQGLSPLVRGNLCWRSPRLWK